MCLIKGKKYLSFIKENLSDSYKENFGEISTELRKKELNKENKESFSNSIKETSLEIRKKILEIFLNVKNSEKHKDKKFIDKIDIGISGSLARDEIVPYSDFDIFFYSNDNNVYEQNKENIELFINETKTQINNFFGEIFTTDVYDVFETNLISPQLLEKRFKGGKNFIGINNFLPIMDGRFLDENKNIKKEKIINTLYKGIQKNSDYFEQGIKDSFYNIKMNFQEKEKGKFDFKKTFYRIIYGYVGLKIFLLAKNGKEDLFKSIMRKENFSQKINELKKLSLTEKEKLFFDELELNHKKIVYIRNILGFIGNETIDENKLKKEDLEKINEIHLFLKEILGKTDLEIKQ